MPTLSALFRPSAVLAARRALSASARLVAARALLGLVLVVAQAGALTHLIGHFADAPHGPSASYVDALGDDHSPADAFGLCLQCLALGGLDLPLGDGGNRGSATAAGHSRPDGAAVAQVAAQALQPRCRAPPPLA